MATYKLGFLLKQEQAGSENAKIKIEMDGSVLVAEQEISQTSATWFPFDWTSSKVPNADGSVKARIKITFLNDYYVDADTDRNVIWQGFGYAYQDPSSSTYIKTVETITTPARERDLNIINQVEEFNKIIPITGIVMTKLDGTAKGGILLALAKKYKLPIIALGLGEKEDDLQIFEAEKFAEAFTQIN